MLNASYIIKVYTMNEMRKCTKRDRQELADNAVRKSRKINLAECFSMLFYVTIKDSTKFFVGDYSPIYG